MSLTLLIENYQILDDGGPASMVVPEGGLQVGRREGMGWVLPDASRHISGHHFDVYRQGEEWWLRDASTNGTFLHGMRHRLDGPHKLEHGDRFQVGQYVVVALMDAPSLQGGVNANSLPSYGGPVFAQETEADPWSMGGGLDPVDPLPRQHHGGQGDFENEFMAFPRHDAAAAHPVAAAPVAAVHPAAPPAATVAQSSASPFESGSVDAGLGGALAGGLVAPLAQAPAPAHAPVSPPQPAMAAADPGAGMLRAFCEGAGLPPDWGQGVPPEAFAYALGQTLRAATSEVMLALRDRASAKQFVRVGERTMRGATDNNPLKFLPDPEQAMEAMFLRPRAGFMTGAAGFDEALRDLRQHQAALFAALQPALMKLVGDLAPEDIEAGSETGRFGSNRKARAWETYVERWDAKAAPHENGMLDEFIQHFAAAYRDALAQGRGRGR
ncbi:type VI secretion system-associated FHA domain protein TagH [Paracoccus aminophilus]|uniref:Type VI secretion system protein ImpI n=1 Tax=Paracoccus aminophilus JCM 7686 TaxID=1367847 RepID=S5Y212_PARAH|nr:type VI secretion system-associated FHA domain protein TagH [Paracoccus aminophilus]AGT11492.1 type VI secretion system protein ImpI [Paracoccus aminophilus JCM 7686]